MSQPEQSFIVERLTVVTPEDLEQVRHLLPQLTGTDTGISYLAYWSLIASEANQVHVARSTGDKPVLVGFAMLVTVKQFVGIKCWIEDVVVHEDWRGHGIGRALMQSLLDAIPPAAKHANLTSKPQRGAAHNLYLDLGFYERDTAVFRHNLGH